MPKKYTNKSKLLGKIGTENYRVSNCPVHLPKENIKFFMAMQDAGNKNPFSTDIFSNQITSNWKNPFHESLLNAIDRGIKNALNESVQYALDDFDYNDILDVKAKNKIIDKENSLYKTILMKEFNELTSLFDNGAFPSFEEYRRIVKISKITGIKYKTEPETDGEAKKLASIIEYIVRNIDEEADLNWIDVTNIKNMSYLFQKSKFNGDISDWDVSNVEDMSYMFDQCAFDGTSSDISNWDVSNVDYMEGMFQYSPFNKTDICNWDVHDLHTAEYMFKESLFCQDISNWNLPLGCNIHHMFSSDFPQNYKPKVIKDIIRVSKENFDEDVEDTIPFEDERARGYYDDLDEGFMFEGECGDCGGVSGSYNTPMNTVGVGNIVPAGNPAMTGAQQASDMFNGSGDITLPQSKKKANKKKQGISYFPIATKK